MRSSWRPRSTSCGGSRTTSTRNLRPSTGPDERTGATKDEASDNTNVICLGFQRADRSEEHTSELQSLMRISYAVFCLNKKNIERENYTTIVTKTLNTRPPTI